MGRLGRSGLALACGGSAAAGAETPGQTLRVGAGQALRTLAQAVRIARDGDQILLDAGRYPGDVAVATQRGLTIRGLGRGAVFDAQGRSAEGKAILVVRGEVAVENCEFRGARVPDGNGAGLRFESGRLVVRRCRFFDNEMGLLTANDPRQELAVHDCTFGAAPRHEGLLHHLLYAGTIGRFTLSGSRFGQGWRGHLVKTRALRSLILYNRLDDGPDGEASYELEFPNGGEHLVLGNVIVQSPRSRNPALLSLGAEAREGTAARLLLVHNTLVNLGDARGRFVHAWLDRLAPAASVRMANNLFAGPGDARFEPFDGGGNHRIALAALRDAAAGDDRLAAGSPLAGTAVPLPPGETPQAEFSAPVGTRALPAGRRLSPGALQPPVS